jgi:hypothetical protein
MGHRLSQKRHPEQRLPDWTTPAGHAVRRWEKSTYQTAVQLVDWTRREQELSDKGAIISRVEKTLRLRYVFRYEMEHLLALSGFEVEGLFGWFDRRPFDDESSEMVWVARKRGDNR